MIYAGIILLCLLIYTLIYALTKNKKPFKRAFVGMLLGVAALVLVNIFGKYFGISVPISPFSLIVSSCGGVPAVAAMVLIGSFL